MTDTENALPESTPELTPQGLQVAVSRTIADQAFKELAIRDTSSIENTVAELIAAKMIQVRHKKPELSEVEAYIVAGRLVKQMARCYLAAVDQLLP